MVYVFHVDQGLMYVFDMKCAIQSVSALQDEIEQRCGIPKSKQVLLISGGQMLDPEAKVGCFGCGTDTNPIFLFNLEFTYPPEYTINDYRSEVDKLLKENLDLPNTRSSIEKRAAAALRICKISVEITRKAETMIHEQHLQQQGWAAVIANVEDTLATLAEQMDDMESIYSEYSDTKESCQKYVDSFKEDVKTLKNIPVLPGLMDDGCDVSLESSDKDQAALLPAGSPFAENTLQSLSLYDWINSFGSSLDDFHSGLNKENLEAIETNHHKAKYELECLIKRAKHSSNFQIQGLGPRLARLEKLKKDMSECLNKINLTSQMFSKHIVNVREVNDPSLFAALCQSHQEYLKKMHENYLMICDCKSKIVNAKMELCQTTILQIRALRDFQSKVIEASTMLSGSGQRLNLFKEQLKLMSQIHCAPSKYFMSVAEVVRRRTFSQYFFAWAADLACRVTAMYNEEVARRREYDNQLKDHFVKLMFRGLDDVPPSYATEPPTSFDSNLPKIMMEDLEELKKIFPELDYLLEIPDISNIINFYAQKVVPAIDLEKPEINRETAKLVEMALDEGLEVNTLVPGETDLVTTGPPILPHLKDLDRGCESETDTEEFEKVGQSPLDLNFEKDAAPRAERQDAAASSQEVCDQTAAPPKKQPSRTFQKHIHSQQDDPSPSVSLQRTLSVSSTQSNTESFTNIKNPSLESIDELSSLKNLPSTTTDSCFNSHHQQLVAGNSSAPLRSKSISPQSPRDAQGESPSSPFLGHQQANEFASDEFYIDESLPSSLSIEAAAGQGQVELNQQLDTAHNVVAMLQDNLQVSRTEHDKVKSNLDKMISLSSETIQLAKNEIVDLRSIYKECVKKFLEEFSNVISLIFKLIKEKDDEYKKNLDRLEVEYKLEIDNLTEVINTLKNDLETSRTNYEILTKENTDLADKNMSLEDQAICLMQMCKEDKNKYDQLLQEKENHVKEVIDQMNREHKTELENIRSRFKLMMLERSPSEGSLDKSERHESLSSNCEMILLQMKETFEFEKQKAVSEAVEAEKNRWREVLERETEQIRSEHERDKLRYAEETVLSVQEEKDKQIELLREREKNLMFECYEYQKTIQRLTDYQSGSSLGIESKIETLECENERLRCQIEALQQEKSNIVKGIAQSFGESISTCRALTSASASEEARPSSFPVFLWSLPLSIDLCREGDLVFVYWDQEHESFRVLQNCDVYYFVHADYLNLVGLKLVDKVPNKYFAVGEIVNKEYCCTKKDPNRYNIPKGTKFHRVIVKSIKKQARESLQSIDETDFKRQPAAEIHPAKRTSTSSVTCGTLAQSVVVEQEKSHRDAEAEPSDVTRKVETGLLVDVKEEEEEEGGRRLLSFEAEPGGYETTDSTDPCQREVGDLLTGDELQPGENSDYESADSSLTRHENR